MSVYCSLHHRCTLVWVPALFPFACSVLFVIFLSYNTFRAFLVSTFLAATEYVRSHFPSHTPEPKGMLHVCLCKSCVVSVSWLRSSTWLLGELMFLINRVLHRLASPSPECCSVKKYLTKTRWILNHVIRNTTVNHTQHDCFKITSSRS